jgi:hypothetical protein
LLRHQCWGVLAATAVAVATPLCSCGTTAVILGMLAGSMPWAPIIAFMTGFLTGVLGLMPAMLFYMIAGGLLGLTTIAIVVIFGPRYLSRQELTHGKLAWLVNGTLWACFHMLLYLWVVVEACR